MGVFYSDMKSKDLPAWQEERANTVAAKDDAATVEIAEQEAANSTPEKQGESGGRLFTQEEVNKIVRERLARERAKAEPNADEAKAARDKMFLDFRADLTKHDLPADEIISTFEGFDFNSPEGLRHAVDDIITLQETIHDYAEELEVQKATRAKMPVPKKADILRRIFGLE